MFKTKIFSVQEVVEGGLDRWLNAQEMPGYGIRITSQVAISVADRALSLVSTTISMWKFEENLQPQVRSTIDEIPEEPSIDADV